MLHAAGQAGVVQRRADDLRRRRVLEHAHAAAHDGARSAHGTLEAWDLWRGAIRPREAEARARVDAVRRMIVAHAEELLDLRVDAGQRREAVSVETNAVLDLQIRRPLVGVA